MLENIKIKEERDAPEEILEWAEKHKENLKRSRILTAPHTAAGEVPRRQGGAAARLSLKVTRSSELVGHPNVFPAAAHAHGLQLFESRCSLEAAYSVTPHSQRQTVFSGFVVEREHRGLSACQPYRLCSRHSGKDGPPST